MQIDDNEMIHFLAREYRIKQGLDQLQRMIGSIDETIARQRPSIQCARTLSRKLQDFLRTCQLLDNLRKEQALLSERLY